MQRSINPQPALCTLECSNLLAAAPVKEAFKFIDGSRQQSTEELIRICEIPAPPFKEQARADYVKRRFEEMGLSRVRQDAEGNIIAERRGRDTSRAVVVSAHLDTVFPEGTDVRVRREGQRLCAPGISDNACGLVSLLSLAGALDAGSIESEASIHFAATVGEEGEGDLRGVRYLFTEGDYSGGVEAFISLDGPGLERITQRALGSRRYRVTISGQGGHSWGDFGIVNPVHALGRAIARFAAYPAPVSPRTSYSVGIIEGGSSVNAIPERAMMTVDMRSVSSDEIDKLESYLHRIVGIAVREENAQRSTSGTSLTFDIEQVGNRPSGETPIESRIVQAAIDCSRALGIEPRLDCSSTDSNIPISLGIPAITLGVGGMSNNCHSLTEWYEPAGRELGLKRLLLLTLALSGINI
ncbi:MAG TPA: M20/M25/M40 family metallo-hydrolase [Blastocatellia bacterium]|jgi:acetylornithine deacetylase/succinyl-diaminopimelate desuccinylase-like protein|nr:M20/M25/M40 family metallo-hydrolase [Blastocatellia bacterium]